jgi:hypothetical protein
MKTTSESMTTKTESELRELRTLDAWLAVNLFGFARTRIPYHPSDNRVVDGAIYSPNGVHYDCGQSSYVPHYHSDPAAAMAVLERCVAHIDEQGTHQRAVEIDMKNGRFRVWARKDMVVDAASETLPLAIARFAKALLEGEKR